MIEHDPRPTFQQIAEKHNLTMQNISAELLFRNHGGMSREAVEGVFFGGVGTGVSIDLCLEALSYLIGEEYTRENVGGFIFIVPQKVQEKANGEA